MKLKNRIAVVTGAARGIGRAIAVTFAGQGATVVLLDRDNVDDTAADIQAGGGNAVPFAVDITDHNAVDDIVRHLVADRGTVDILVNNAGIIARGTIETLSHEEWQAVMNVNVNGAFNCCKSVIPHMVKKEYGRIVNITSIAGKMGDITAAPAYGTSKGAVNTLTKSLARSLAQYGITVNAVAPHAVETDMSAQWSEEKRRDVIESIPLKRLCRPEEVAAATLFLASDDAAFITGEVLNINGGFLMD